MTSRVARGLRLVKNPPPGNPGDGSQDRLAVCDRFAATQALKQMTGLWKTPILLLLLERPHGFADLERALAPISAKVLTERLKELVQDGLVLRVELISAPPKQVEYRLTARGEATRPIFEALAAWARAAPERAGA